jgi:lipopolysaccharide biosynthesis regulator YciM
MVIDIFRKLRSYNYHEDKIKESIEEIKEYFISSFKDQSIKSSDYKIFKLSILDNESSGVPQKLTLLKSIIDSKPEKRVMNKAKVEICRLLLTDGRSGEALEVLNELKQSNDKDLVINQCYNCGYESNHFFWRCPQCQKWESINFKEVI